MPILAYDVCAFFRSVVFILRDGRGIARVNIRVYFFFYSRFRMSINHNGLPDRFFSLFPRYKQREIAEYLYPEEGSDKKQSQISRWKTRREPIPWDALERVVEKGLADWNYLLSGSGDSQTANVPASNQVEKQEEAPTKALKFPPLVDIPGPSGKRFSFSGDQLPTRGQAAGGRAGIEFDDYGEPRVMSNGLLGIPVHGDSMSPVILDKQLALIDMEREGFETNDGIYVVYVQEPGPQDERKEQITGTFVKRVQWEEDTYYLKSANDAYSPFPVYVDHCRIWPVLGIWFDGMGQPPEGF